MDSSKTGQRIGWTKPGLDTSMVYSDFMAKHSPPYSDYRAHCDTVHYTHFEMAHYMACDRDASTHNNLHHSSSTNQRSPSNASDFSGPYVTSKPPSLIKIDDVIHNSNSYDTQRFPTSQISPTPRLVKGSSYPTKYSEHFQREATSSWISNVENSRSRKRTADSDFDLESTDYKDGEVGGEFNQIRVAPNHVPNSQYPPTDSSRTVDDDDVDNVDDDVKEETRRDMPRVVRGNKDAKKLKLSRKSPVESSRNMKSNAEDKNKGDNSGSSRTPFLPPCKICGAKASGFHYGVNSCEACKGFFRRVLKRPVVFFCTKNNSCNLKRNKRSSCRFCRYKRCLSLGMSKEAIKTGRYSHQKRTQDIMAVKYLQTYKDPDHDYFELDEILENLLVSHQSNIVSSARFQDSFLYKKQKDYHKMFLMHKKIVSTTVDYLKNNGCGSDSTLENAPTRIPTTSAQGNSQRGPGDDASNSISDLATSSIPHNNSSKLARILLRIPSKTDISQSSPEKSVSPTGSSSSCDSGFSDYYGNSYENGGHPTDHRNSSSPPTPQRDFQDTPILSQSASSKSSTSPSHSSLSSPPSPSSPSSSSSSSSLSSSSISHHTNDIKPHSVDFLDESDTKILEEILKEFKRPVSGTKSDSRKAGLDLSVKNVPGNQIPEIKMDDSHAHPNTPNSSIDNSSELAASRNPLLLRKLQNLGSGDHTASEQPQTVSAGKDSDSTSGKADGFGLDHPVGVLKQGLRMSKPSDKPSSQKHKDTDHFHKAAQCVTGYINFAKSIPGFESLPKEDQAMMLRLAWDEIWILGAYRGFNCELDVSVMPSGVCFHMGEMEQSWGQGYAKLAFDLADILKKSGVTEEMLVLLKAICIVSPDRCDLKDKEKVEKTHWLLVRCLINHLDTAMPKPEMTFPGLVAILTSLRNLSELAQTHLSQGILDLQVDSVGRNILSEPVTPF